MSLYFHLRAVPPPALRNSATWFRRLFADDWTTVRERIGRHREEVLDKTSHGAKSQAAAVWGMGVKARCSSKGCPVLRQ
jgi:hypothetical protein